MSYNPFCRIAEWYFRIPNIPPLRNIPLQVSQRNNSMVLRSDSCYSGPPRTVRIATLKHPRINNRLGHKLINNEINAFAMPCIKMLHQNGTFFKARCFMVSWQIMLMRCVCVWLCSISPCSCFMIPGGFCPLRYSMSCRFRRIYGMHVGFCFVKYLDVSRFGDVMPITHV